MNLYYRAIGMSQINSKQKLNKLVKSIVENPDEQLILGRNNTDIHVEYYRKYGENFGLIVRGTLDQKEKLKVENAYPYAYSETLLSCDNIEAENLNGEYIVVCEDKSTGNELVFHLQNVLDFLEEDEIIPKHGDVNIVGLSTNGTIILPVAKDEEYEELRKEEEKYYRGLMDKAKNGDAQAKELLQIQEEETAEIMHERLMEEDFFSVVEGFFMPVDYDDTTYSILGEIIGMSVICNPETTDTLYILNLNITGTIIGVCINKEDLEGEPSIGMRFMGSCWLQGKLVLDKK